mmetsp:Transcript_4181/g.11794  ORF Transcript_4181/g.11794 Transcript_4181/m.11794 type:complete len:100 (+) Transcript_4181:145-444(+)|eukprot:CAMPEP_0117656560 /NCGR_PEP_ID=MMETSP0804-20121206/4870_1 /TAXON_ID=1074897 /ORGANISM="Tetraselmis astigmatica, Strain CCMP880" /LENGTH=99 /DNA_ID=CAMNT_0005462971 /DNA_START=127 /DNA_END=426 /DNA_ORIENTATION=-
MDGSGGGDDLYGDIYGKYGESEKLLSARVAELEEKLLANEASIAEKDKEVLEVKAENARLIEQNKTLIRNISCLYRTAVEEINRKDILMNDIRTQQSNK